MSVEAGLMGKRLNPIVDRRVVVRGITGVVVGSAANAVPLAPAAAADTERNNAKRKARYRANSAVVQSFYRVNRYPGQ
jgi:hypothetical protein